MSTAVETPPVTIEMVEEAAARIRGAVDRTPVLTSAALNAATGHNLFFKCENLQRTGSFKARGAANAVFSLDDAIAAKGVVCHSSGNHGAAVAAAARARGVPAVVVVPRTTVDAKIQNIASFGARVVLCEPNPVARRETAAAESAALGGAEVLHPFDDARVIAGQGTLALELIEQARELTSAPLDAILVPVSGGGMLTGVAVAAAARADGCAVHAVEPAGKGLGAALEAGTRVMDASLENVPVPTVCDAMPTRCLGPTPWALAHGAALVDARVLTANDAQVVGAMRVLFEGLRVVVEPAAATGLAALLDGQLPARADGAPRNVGIVLCGGNIDLDAPMPWVDA